MKDNAGGDPGLILRRAVEVRVDASDWKDADLRFTALLHHLSEAFLSNSFYALKREAAPGVDGLTWQEYETDLDKRLEDLHSRGHRGPYRAPLPT